MKLGKIKYQTEINWQFLNITPAETRTRHPSIRKSYSEFSHINGHHPLKESIPDAFVDYPARLRRGGKVGYFNFNLAKEMGLIPQTHPMVLNQHLEDALLKTFGITIINEYDFINQVPIPEEDLLPDQTYMATRYLQLQHPNKKGHTSGDGRSIWNGHYKGKSGKIWDISSCGTGATCLSPATAIENKFFRTGDPQVAYGCGHADLSDGFTTLMMSEIFHRSGIKTERTLAVIEYPNEQAIVVRAHTNLMRPSHLFIHLKQGNYDALKLACDYYIQRQMLNGEMPKNLKGKKKYKFLLETVAKNFAQACARFENDYIFCWLDWDGDNILMDGGIIDYGSVRQFGLYHHEYRYDDVDRFSTTIPEQKSKARYIVQTFAQLVDFLITGKKKNIKHFKNHPILKTFDNLFEQHLEISLLKKIGFNDTQTANLFKYHREDVKHIRRIFSYFERAKSSRGKHNTADGITWDAVFCMRDILREFPLKLQRDESLYSPVEFLDIIASKYAQSADLKLNEYRIRLIKEFQYLYIQLMQKAGGDKNYLKTLLEVGMRSSIINRYERITGDAIIYVADEIINHRKQLCSLEVHRIVEDFVTNLVLDPEYFKKIKQKNKTKIQTKKAKKILKNLIHVVRECREGI